MAQAERFVSHLPLYRPQKRANEVVGRINLYKDIVPLSRQRCVEVAALYNARQKIHTDLAGE